ncbi:type I secretion system permease/ATPase [Sphingomonas sp. GCM10030256]|uniref:type I secretion system permease/ATPase n=1 Tax=Sphingomonas sp. GCM10030256 TaxID=3273427 RepID=UPI00360DB278
MRLMWLQIPDALGEPVRACRRHFLLAAGFSALINILYLAPTIYMMQVYDRVVPTGGLMTLYWITLIVAVAIGVLAALDAARVRLMMRASLRLDRLLAPMILDRSLLQARRGADIPPGAEAMRQFDVLRQALSGPAMLAIMDAPWAPLYLVVAFIIHPLLGAIVVAGAAILVVLAKGNERHNKLSAARAHDAMASAYASQEASYREAEIVRTLGMRRALVARHGEERRAGFGASLETQFSGSRYNALVKFVRMFMQSFALGAGAWLAVKGEISIGAIIAASVLLSRALQPIEQLVTSWPQIAQARKAVGTIETLFDATGSATERRTALPDPTGHIELDRVVVQSPDGAAALLKSVSFSLAPGQLLGIIGPSGAGKTTLARVICGAIAPDLGEARLDGANIALWDPETLAAHVGYLPQTCSLLPGTVAENISRFAVAGASSTHPIDAEVVRAAKMAGVHDTILRLPHGYDTRLAGPGGHTLSVGQAQRIALARALYGNPRVLVLDEPNSALDAEGEEALKRAVAAARLNGAAVAIVAHRSSALAAADLLLVLSDGAVALFGPRNEVLEELARRTAKTTVVPLKERA